MPDHDGRLPIRPLYLAAEFVAWVDGTEALDDQNWSKRSGGRSRFEHLEQALADFRCDARPLVGDLNRVIPTSKGVWKMQCPGLRIYGWPPDVYSFVAVTAAFAEDVHGNASQTDAKVKEVVDFLSINKLLQTMQYGERSGLFRKKA